MASLGNEACAGAAAPSSALSQASLPSPWPGHLPCHLPVPVPSDGRDCSPMWARYAMPQPSTAPTASAMTPQALPQSIPAGMAQSIPASQQVRSATPPLFRVGTPGPMRGPPAASQSQQPSETQCQRDTKAVDIDLGSVRLGSAEVAPRVAASMAASMAASSRLAEPSFSVTSPPRGDKPMVCVPADHKAGQPVAIRTAAGLVLLPLPPGAKPGDEIAFEVEALPPELADYGQGPDGSDSGEQSSCVEGDTETDVMTLCGTVTYEQGGSAGTTAEALTNQVPTTAALPLRSPTPSPQHPSALSSPQESISQPARGCHSAPCLPPPRSIPSPSPALPSPLSRGLRGHCRKANASMRASRETPALPPPLVVPQLGRVASMYPESPLLDRRLLLNAAGAAACGALPPHSGGLSSPPHASSSALLKDTSAAPHALEAAFSATQQQQPASQSTLVTTAVLEPTTPADMQSERAERRRLRADRHFAGVAALDDEELLVELARRKQLAAGRSLSQPASAASPAARRDVGVVACEQDAPRSHCSGLRSAGLTGAGAPPPPDVCHHREQEPRTSGRELRHVGQATKGRGPGKPRSWPLPIGGAGRLPPPPNFLGSCAASGSNLGPDPAFIPAAGFGGFTASHFDHVALQPPSCQPIDVCLDGIASPWNPGALGRPTGSDAALPSRGSSVPASGVATRSAAASWQTPEVNPSSVPAIASGDLPAYPPLWLTGRPVPPGSVQSNTHYTDSRASLQNLGSYGTGASDKALARKLYQRFGLDGCMSFEKFAAQLDANKDAHPSPACGGA